MDIPSGMREMQTFRKLPITRPKRKKKKGITGLTVPQARKWLNAGKGAGCRMANEKKSQVGSQQLVVGSNELPTTDSQRQTVACAKLNAYGDELVRTCDPAV